MHSLRDENYRVEFMVGVWKQLEQFSPEQHRQLSLDLQELARKLSEAIQDGAPEQPQIATLGGLRVRFEITPSRRMLTVLDVSPVPER